MPSGVVRQPYGSSAIGRLKRVRRPTYRHLTPTGRAIVEWLVDGRSHLEPYSSGRGWRDLGAAIEAIEGLLNRIDWQVLTTDPIEKYEPISRKKSLIYQAVAERAGYGLRPLGREQGQVPISV